MEEASFLLSLLALTLSSMDLALAIVWSERASYKWSKALVVFASTVFGLIFCFSIASFLNLFPGVVVYSVLEGVCMALAVMVGAFLFVFSPIFFNFLIARPTSKAEKVVFPILGTVFLGIGMLNIFLPLPCFPTTALVMMLSLILYVSILMGRSFPRIKDRTIRLVTLMMMIVSISLRPFSILSLFIASIRTLVILASSCAYFITLLVFLFAANSRETMKEKREKKSDEEEEKVTEGIYESYHITEREREIIALVKKGLTNKEIASSLGISVNTVNNHMANIFSKTNVSCRIDLLNLLSEASW